MKLSLNTENEPCVKNIQVIYNLQEKYQLLNEAFKNAVSNLDDFRVITPVVGKFSTGKSSLLNSLIGKNQFNKFYLGVDLTPETAVPTEITYGATDKIFIIDNEVHSNEISLDEYLNKTFSADKTSKIQLILDNAFYKIYKYG